jgi:hypothetical protein
MNIQYFYYFRDNITFQWTTALDERCNIHKQKQSHHTNKLTHSLTPWSRVLLEKLLIIQLVKKLPAFNGTQRFIIVFRRANKWSLSWARCTCPIPRPCVTFCNKEVFFFLSEELLDPCPTPKLKDHPFLAVCECLFNIFSDHQHTK